MRVIQSKYIKPKYLIVSLLLIFFSFLFTSSKKDTSQINTSPTPTTLPSVLSSLADNTNEGTESSILSNDKKYLVTKIIDGDTIAIETGEKVRYIGIDTPEKDTNDCYSSEATEKNKQLVGGKYVTLVKDVSETDRYGRLLRYVYLEDNTFVNEILVKEGYAHLLTYPPDVKYKDIFVAAQEIARKENRGLWATCVTQKTPSPIPTLLPTATPNSVPNPLMQTTPSPQTSESLGSCNIKGNISAKGEKIYHLPGCGSYEKTKIDVSQGEKMFCTEEEAINAGFRKAKNCP